MKTLGVIINPVAGLGGSVALKGSDGAETAKKALALGAKPKASERAIQALEVLKTMDETPRIICWGADMGENQLREAGFSPVVIGEPQNKNATTPQDTEKAAAAIKKAGADLLCFAGGDGTARNICTAIGESLPVVGIPAGVKIHSAVYAVNPRSAGSVIKSWLQGSISNYKSSEVMDIDEDLFRQGIVNAKLYGYMTVPSEEGRIQDKKSGSTSSGSDDLDGMARYICDSMEKDVIYVIGPGSTTRPILENFGLKGTLLGIDVMQNGKLLACDVTEPELYSFIKDPTLRVKIIITIIGGQGNLLGRGNQQLSPRVLRRVGKNNIMIVSPMSKLLFLHGKPLLVDTGDPELDRELCGYYKIWLAYNQTSFYRVSDMSDI